MGIAKGLFNNILGNIFTAGHEIRLFSTMPDASTESGWVEISGTGYERYKIVNGDFSVSSGSATSTANMMFYLCESLSGHGTAKGFGVFDSKGSLLYFGEFKSPMVIGYNTVPTIKKYNGSDEGIRITMTSTEINATSE